MTNILSGTASRPRHPHTAALRALCFACLALGCKSADKNSDTSSDSGLANAGGSGGASSSAAGGTTTTGNGGEGGEGGAPTESSSSNSTTSTTGAGGTDSTTATTGTLLSTCDNPIAGTDRRPQLSDAEASEFSVRNYLSRGGTTAAPTLDFWDPTEGLGDAENFAPHFVVSADGSGTHETLQAALDDAAGTERRYILVEPGTYRETISIPIEAPPITLYGASTDNSQVVIVDNKSALSAGGTTASATFTVKSAGFQALNLTISNDFDTPSGGSSVQAVALKTQGDQTVLENVRLHGFQDTLYLDSLEAATIARVYIKDSFIEGDTDFIFGRATAVIENSTIHYLSSRKQESSGILFAPSTHVDNPYGFLVVASEFTSDATTPESNAYLGRSWDTSSTTPTPNGQLVIRESVLGPHVRIRDPWTAAATSGRFYDVTENRLYEYCNTGPGTGE